MSSAADVGVAFADCNGDSKRLIRGDIALRFATVSEIGNAEERFWSDQLRNCLVTEAELFLDRALYHACAGKNMIADGKLSWAIVTFYYASFFAVNALVRLRGECPLWIDRQAYWLKAVDPLDSRTDLFSIRKRERGGPHQVVWHLFQRQYLKFVGDARFLPVLQPENILWDLHKRHDTNYDLALGYQEIGLKTADFRREIRRRNEDVLAELQKSLSDEDLAIETRALLRIQFLVELIRRIESASVYGSFFASRRNRRIDFVGRSVGQTSLRNRLLAWLT